MWLEEKQPSLKKLVCATWVREAMWPLQPLTELICLLHIDVCWFLLGETAQMLFHFRNGKAEWQSWVMCPTCSYSQLTFIKPLLCARPYAVEGWEVSCLRCGSLQLSSNWRMDHWMKAGLDHCLNVDRPYVFNFLILCVKALLCTSSLLESWVNWSWMWATVLPQCHGGPLSPFLLFITYPIILQLHWIFIQQPLCG